MSSITARLLQFFSLDSLFGRFVPSLSQPFLYGWVAVVVILFVIGFVVSFYINQAALSGPLKRWWRGVSTRAMVASLLALLLLALRVEQTPVLGSRFWIVLWVLGVVISFGRHLWYRWRTLPVQLSEYDRRARLGRYLPK